MGLIDQRLIGRRLIHRRLAGMLLAVTLCGYSLEAKGKQEKQRPAEQSDQIVVDSRIALPNASVTGFVFTQHYNRRYVYAEVAGGAPPMLIDITRLDAPKLVSALSAGGNAAPQNLAAVAGTVALAGNAPVPARAPQTIRILDYSDPAHPKTTREFDGVTAIASHNGVILLANSEGIWILSQKLAEDPAEQERYARKVIYGESMY